MCRILTTYQEEMAIDSDDEAFKDVPIVINVDGETVMTAAAASEKADKKKKQGHKYNSDFERVRRSDSSSESDSSSDESDNSSRRPAKKRRTTDNLPPKPRKKEKEKKYTLTAAQMQRLMSGRAGAPFASGEWKRARPTAGRALYVRGVEEGAPSPGARPLRPGSERGAPSLRGAPLVSEEWKRALPHRRARPPLEGQSRDRDGALPHRGARPLRPGSEKGHAPMFVGT
ncbi:hypothetical protein H0H92_012041 [Tricholoma furcatifolium]|nr:hypothetical protein H0H92_012041 [Tricholoma furcatifolium]